MPPPAKHPKSLYHPAIILLTILLIITTHTGCNNTQNTPSPDNDKIIVVATILPLADWARQIGGKHIHTTTLLPPGASPHTFDPTPRDMRQIANASLLLKVGLQMDDWAANLHRANNNKKTTILSIGDQLQQNHQLPHLPDSGPCNHPHHNHTETSTTHDHDHHDHHHHGVNPHFWLDPILAIESIKIIRDHLTQIDPKNTQDYHNNANQYITQLNQLHQKYHDTLQPHQNKAIITFHDAWPYLAQRYQIQIAAVIEEFPGKTPSEKYLREITDLLNQHNIKTIFTEPQLNPHVAQIIANEINGNISLLDPYGTQDTPGRENYINTMEYNLTQLQTALTQTQPLN